MQQKVVDYAPFVNYEEPYIVSNEKLIKWYKQDYFKKGTWDFPIITVKQNERLLIIDGTNRFRHMMICLKSKFDFIKNEHLVYVLNDKEY